MSFAIIQTGGKQYKVSASEILKVERLDSEVGKIVEFKNVLFLNNNKTTLIGNPNITGAKVEAEILKNTKNKTVIVFKRKRRKHSRKKNGHRQPISIIKITKIFSNDGKIIAEAKSTEKDDKKKEVKTSSEKTKPIKKKMDEKKVKNTKKNEALLKTKK